MSASSALAGLALVVIGESHMASPDYLLNPIHQALSEQGAKVHSIGVCGASPGRWLEPYRTDCGRAEKIGDQPPVVEYREADGVNIIEILKKEKRDVIVVIIGDTIASYANPEFPMSWAYKEVTSLTRAIADTGTLCYWVGPAWGQPAKRFYKTPERVELVNKFLADNVAPCVYIDSTNFSKPGEWKTTDGVHYTVKYYRSWARAIADTISALAAQKRNP